MTLQPDSTPHYDADLLATLIAERLAVQVAEQQARRFFTVAQAATYTALSEDSIRAMLAGGKLTALRPVRGRILIDRRQLDAVVLSSTGRLRTGRGIHTKPTAPDDH
jgi:excisionase family DNA binding protein